MRQGGPGPFNSNSLICSMSISPSFFFFKNIFSPKNWQGGGELLLQNRAIDGYAYDPFYSQVRFTFRGAPGTLGIIATSSCQI